MGVDEELRSETLKWLDKCEKIVPSVKCSDNKFLTNIKAYISDSHHFLDSGDLVRAFEAVIWAWAWLEIGKDIGKVEYS